METVVANLPYNSMNTYNWMQEYQRQYYIQPNLTHTTYGQHNAYWKPYTHS